jgi:hypothetical protein
MYGASCQIPPVLLGLILLGLIDEEGRLVANEFTRGPQLLALVCAKSANDELAKVVPLARVKA